MLRRRMLRCTLEAEDNAGIKLASDTGQGVKDRVEQRRILQPRMKLLGLEHEAEQ